MFHVVNTSIEHLLLLLLSRLSETLWTAAHQAPLSMGFSRQEYWTGLPFPSPIQTSRGTSNSTHHKVNSLFHSMKCIPHLYYLWITSVTQPCPTLGDPMGCSTLGFPVHHELLELIPTHVHWVSDAIQSSHPLSSLLLLPSIFPSIRVFSNKSVLCTRWPKYWSFSVSPSNEYPGLISFRMDWLDLPVVQGTLKSLLQHHSSKTSILWF